MQVLLFAFCGLASAFQAPGMGLTSRHASPAVTMSAGKGPVPSKMKWVPFVQASECQKGTVTSGFKYGLEVAVVCDEAGGLYALSNKLPPFGYPTSFATVGKGFILDPVTQSAFKLTTGEPVGPWCPSPPGIGPVIFNLISKPTKAETFKCRKIGGAVEVLINVNAKAQFEQGYWRGILDAQGKVDGGYY
jgi:nitrite reductase/ring-hydroxylating ferredoxin subunit